MKKLLAHGVVLPDTIETIANEYPSVNVGQIKTQMKKVMKLLILYQVNTQQIIKLIANNNFDPKDILNVLSNNDHSNIIFPLVNQGSNIQNFMIRLGYKELTGMDKPTIKLNMKNFMQPGQFEEHFQRSGFDYRQWFAEHFPSKDYLYDNEGEFEPFNDRFVPQVKQQPKGKLVHFIPSSQMKVLRGSF